MYQLTAHNVTLDFSTRTGTDPENLDSPGLYESCQLLQILRPLFCVQTLRPLETDFFTDNCHKVSDKSGRW